MAMFRTRDFLVDHFQTAQRLVATLYAHKIDAPRETAVEKWFLRGSVPGSWLPILIAVLEDEHGEPISIKTYVGGER